MGEDTSRAKIPIGFVIGEIALPAKNTGFVPVDIACAVDAAFPNPAAFNPKPAPPDNTEASARKPTGSVIIVFSILLKPPYLFF